MHQQSVDLILRRCRMMNCIYEGQTFSFNVVADEFSDREAASATMVDMQSSGLLSMNAHGAFVLTREGAEAIVSHTLSEETKPKRAGWQQPRSSRPKQVMPKQPFSEK